MSIVIEKNGIKINARLNRHQLIYSVESQSPQFTKLLRHYKHVRDAATGLSLRSNKRPSFSRQENRFFVRGDETEHDNKQVVAKFPSEEDAQEALKALDRLIDKVRPEEVPSEKISIGEAVVARGGTSHVRMYLISKSQAQKLQLTGNKLWPENSQWVVSKPHNTNDIKQWHFQEHLGQIVDILNKSVSKDTPEEVQECIVNPHKVSHKQAERAVNAFKKFLKDAEDGEYLVAAWRIVSGIRSTDFQSPNAR